MPYVKLPPRDASSLLTLIGQRVVAAGGTPDLYLRDVIEIVVFGSVAAGLDRIDSDIDVLYIGQSKGKLKTERLDLLLIPEAEANEPRWLGSELAGHIFRYGVWVKGSRDSRRWTTVSEESVEAKRQRVAAFMRRLPEAWDDLDGDFRLKYAVKIRREMQRLMLLESESAVPPTRLLDDAPAEDLRERVCERLRAQIVSRNRRFGSAFLKMVVEQWTGECVARSTGVSCAPPTRIRTAALPPTLWSA